MLSKNPVFTWEDLPQEVREGLPPPYDNAGDEQLLFSDTPSLEEIKKRYALYVMNRTRGNISRAAKVLDIDRRSLYRMLARWKIESHRES